MEAGLPGDHVLNPAAGEHKPEPVQIQFHPAAGQAVPVYRAKAVIINVALLMVAGVVGDHVLNPAAGEHKPEPVQIQFHPAADQAVPVQQAKAVITRRAPSTGLVPQITTYVLRELALTT
jgi:hypothetical protein